VPDDIVRDEGVEGAVWLDGGSRWVGRMRGGLMWQLWMEEEEEETVVVGLARMERERRMLWDGVIDP